MADLYLLKGSSNTVDAPLGYCLLGYNLAGTKVTSSIVIQPEKPFLYAQKKLLAALNSGTITQAIYNIITENENETRQLYEINDDLDIDKDLLLDLVNRYGISNVEPSGTAAEITKDIILEGYQIIKKI